MSNNNFHNTAYVKGTEKVQMYRSWTIDKNIVNTLQNVNLLILIQRKMKFIFEIYIYYVKNV